MLATATTTTTDLAPEFVQRAQHLCSVFRAGHGPTTSSTKQKREISLVMKDVVSLFTDVLGSGRNNSHFERVCMLLALETWSEESLHHLCKQLVSLGLSRDNTSMFARMSILPRVFLLKRSASRTLVNVMMDLSKSQPQSVVDGVMIPSLLHGGEKECTAASVELVSRVAKSLPTEQVTRFIGVLLAGEATSQGGSGGGRRVSISEQSLVLFKSLLSLKKLNLPPAPHVEELIGWFERCLQSNENVMSKSMKLASAVHVLITKHLKKRNGGGAGGGGGSSSIGGIHDHVGRVESLVTKLNTFMTKSSLAALNRLK